MAEQPTSDTQPGRSGPSDADSTEEAGVEAVEEAPVVVGTEGIPEAAGQSGEDLEA